MTRDRLFTARRSVRHTLLVVVLGASSSMPLAARQKTTVIRGGSLFDGTSTTVVPNPGIVIRAGKIMAVGNALDLGGSEPRLIELDDDDVLLPGLFDLHAHYSVTLAGEPRTEEFRAQPAIYLANGVTSTFPAGEYDPDGMGALRTRIDRGEQAGPRIFNSGPYFGSARPGWDHAVSRQWIYDEVDRWAERGVRGFKAKGIRPEHLEPLIERAHQHGLTVTGHLGSGYRGTVNPRDAILMGIDRVEHFLGGPAFPAEQSAYASFPTFRPDSPEFLEILDLFKRHGVTYDATIVAYAYFGASADTLDTWTDEQRFFSPKVRDWLAARGGRPGPPNEQFDAIYEVKCPIVKAFHDGGGTLSLGTDQPSRGRFLPGFSIHREIQQYVRCGIPPGEVLQIATQNNARAIGVSESLGTIEVGKLADMFVVSGNPLEDIRRTRDVRWVMKGGRLFRPEELLKAVEGILEPGAGGPTRR